MDNETKVTYAVIASLIILLGGLAYILQGVDTPETNKESTKVTKTETKPLTTTTGTQAVQATTTASTTKPMEQTTFTSATITTNKGVIEVTFTNATPLTVKNFGTLAKQNFYNGVRFHRVIKDFMIQTGDPLSKDNSKQGEWGTGGPGYKFNDELTGAEQYPLGTLAMANSGPNTNGSQFFIVTANPGVNLPPSYTVFGKVTKGIEIANAIQNVKTTGSYPAPGTPADRPLEEIIIEKIEVR